MGDEGPKLFASKPKKSKLKASSTGAMAPPPPPPPLPPYPKVSFRSRYRVLVPLVLALNFSIGAYVLVKTTFKDERISEEEMPEGATSAVSTSTSIHAAHSTTTNSRGPAA
ncbi:hypothetical protein C2S53_014927 [Perilla frutescens var. hirtella]|uniref:Uncharacterized protein n=1 Tax=Perilla frutescens var. hirtella TaxID=608512 RepID=A0AAD4P8D9_PERFH|nr:hypothetical protein C2S53_014927 [Perilla frutescens var. hirtella]